jgi:hypothetical protein
VHDSTDAHAEPPEKGQRRRVSCIIDRFKQRSSQNEKHGRNQVSQSLFKNNTQLSGMARNSGSANTKPTLLFAADTQQFGTRLSSALPQQHKCRATTRLATLAASSLPLANLVSRSEWDASSPSLAKIRSSPTVSIACEASSFCTTSLHHCHCPSNTLPSSFSPHLINDPLSVTGTGCPGVLGNSFHAQHGDGNWSPLAVNNWKSSSDQFPPWSVPEMSTCYSYPCTGLSISNRHPQLRCGTLPAPRSSYKHGMRHSILRESPDSLLGRGVCLRDQANSSCISNVPEKVDESVSDHDDDHASPLESSFLATLSPGGEILSPLPSIDKCAAPLTCSSESPLPSPPSTASLSQPSSPISLASSLETSPQVYRDLCQQHAPFLQPEKIGSKRRSLLWSPGTMDRHAVREPLSNLFVQNSPAKRSPLDGTLCPRSHRKLYARHSHTWLSQGHVSVSANCPGQKRGLNTCLRSVRKKRCHSFCTITEACKEVQRRFRKSEPVIGMPSEIPSEPTLNNHGVIFYHRCTVFTSLVD